MKAGLSRKTDSLDPKAISSIFELEFHAQLFFSRCQDTGEKPDIQKAKMFKQSLNKLNTKKNPNILNLSSVRLGVNTIMKLTSILDNNPFTQLNLADNSISEYGMHAIKTLIGNCKIQHLNLASNMISEVGLSLILEEFIKNTTIKTLNLGIHENSIRKNSFGIDGARCLAAILLQNKTLESLILQDNDLGIVGAEIISIPLKKNKQLKQLKISQNQIKTEGAQYILINGQNLVSLDLGKNFIKSSIGPTLKRYLQTNKNIKKLNLQYNELMPEGVQPFFQTVTNSPIQDINIRGNGLGDRGMALIESTMRFINKQLSHLHYLDISANDLTPESVKNVIEIVQTCELKRLNISQNWLGDEGVIALVDSLCDSKAGDVMEKLDLSACKISDRGFMHLCQRFTMLPELRYLKANDNYISEKYEKIYAELLDKNHVLISLSLQGNRLSLGGLKAVKKPIDRNLKNYQQKQPKKMKSQILNLKQKQRKIKQVQQRIQKQKRQISKLEETKNRLNDNITRLEKEERDKRQDYEKAVEKKNQTLAALAESTNSKMESFEAAKQQKQKNIEDLTTQLLSLRQKRKQLEYQLTVAENEGEMIEKQFQKKARKLK